MSKARPPKQAVEVALREGVERHDRVARAFAAFGAYLDFPLPDDRAGE